MVVYKYLIVLLLLLPCVSALSISDVTLLRNGGAVTTINPNIPQTVSVSLLTDATSGTINVDLTDLGGARGSVRVSDCESEGVMRRCTIENMRISRAGTIESWISVGGSASAKVETPITLTVDTLGPSVSSLKTSVCVNSTCYIGNNALMNLTILVRDGPVSTGNFYYQVGNVVQQPKACGPLGCIDIVRVACLDGAQLQLRVLDTYQGVRSTDDAGNAFVNVRNVTQVICDANAPQIVSKQYNGTGPGGAVAQGGRLQVLAVVRESTPASISVGVANLQFNVSENATIKGTCKNMGDGLQACGVSVGSLAFGSNLLVPITIRDAVGLETKSSIQVAQIMQVANATERPDLFDAQATSTMPASINRVALDLALENGFEFQHMISYQLRSKESGARVLYTKVLPQTCRIAPSTGADAYRANSMANWSVAPALYSPLSILNPTAGVGVMNRLDGSFLSANIVTDENIVMCNISLVVAKYNKVYAQEEMETLYWPLNLRNSKLGTPGGAFIEKIEIEKAKLNGGVNRILSTATKITSTMTHVCQIQGVMNQATNQMVALEGVALSMSFIPGMQAVSGAAGGAAGSLITLSSQTWMGDIFGGALGKASGALSEVQGPIQKMCHYIHCDVNEKMQEAAGGEGNAIDPNSGTQKGFESLENAIEKTAPARNAYLNSGSGIANSLEGIGGNGDGRMSVITDEMFSGLNTPDVSNSLFASMATGCFPGVVYNLDKYRQIDCGYLQCLKEQALGGQSITVCEEARGTKMCTAVMGEVFELPFVRVFKNLVGNVNQVIQNSGFIAAKLIMGKCTPAENSAPAWSNPKAFACRIMNSVENTKQFSSVTNYNSVFRPPYEQDLCSAVLCEGDKCEKTSGSYLEASFFPGYVGYTWPQRQVEQRLIDANNHALNGLATQLIAVKAQEELLTKLNTIRGKYNTLIEESATNTNPEWSKQLAAIEKEAKDWEEETRLYMHNMGLNPQVKLDKTGDILSNGDKVVAEIDAVAQQDLSKQDKEILEKIWNKEDTSISAEKILELNKKACQSKSTKECLNLLEQAIKSEIPPRDDTEMTNLVNEISQDITDTQKWQDVFKPLAKLDQSNLCALVDASGQCTSKPCFNDINCEVAKKELEKIESQLNGRLACKIDGELLACVDTCSGECISVERASKLSKDFAKDVANQKMKDYLNGVIDIGSQWAVSQGYFDVLTLGSWGSWGEKISGATDNVMNPEQWKANICNPRGDLKDLTKDQSSVYLFQRGSYRPVLTFAAERLELPDGQYLYTVSTVITSTEYDITATILLDSVELGEIPLSKDTQESRAFSLASNEFYSELCVQFDKAFPQAGDGKEYCRDVKLNAYDRGAQVTYDFDYGKDNPWESEIANEDAITATALSTLGAVAGGKQEEKP